MDVEVKNTKKDTAEESFLNELKSQFEKLLDLKKTLDSKANTMITIASTLVTINIAIGTFLLTKIVIEDDNFFYYIPIGVLGLGVVFAVISIWRFINSFGIRDYDYPMGSTYFFSEQGEYKEKEVNKIRNLSQKEFNDTMYNGYLTSIKKAEDKNTSKANNIEEGQKFLTFALITIVALVVLVLVFTGAGYLSLIDNQPQ